MCLKTTACKANHRKLAVELSRYALKYIDSAFSLNLFAEQYNLLLKIRKGEILDDGLLDCQIFELRKAHYQARFKKGGFYQFKYIVSGIVLAVFEAHSKTEYSSYNAAYFQNFITTPVCKHTIPEYVPKAVVKKLTNGTLVNWADFAKKLEPVKPKKAYVNEYV